MILSIGEILFDIFPEYRRIGGAPFNFAFHLKKLGVPVRFISRVGKDTEGEEIYSKIKEYGFSTDDLQVDKTHKTGKVIVKLDKNGIPDFSIQRNAAYDFLKTDRSILSTLDRSINLIYFGTLIQRSICGFESIQTILAKRNSETKCMYDINLRPDCYDKEIIMESLRRADILKLNNEELETIKQMFGYKKETNRYVEYLMNKFSLEMVALTGGYRGSELFLKGQHTVHRSVKINDIVDTVGAGDGFAAMLAIGFLRNWDPKKMLSVASEFAEQICRIEGAIPVNGLFYDKFRIIIADEEQVN